MRDLGTETLKLPPRLSVRNLSVERNGKRLIDNISLTLDSPGLTLIMGPNGAGKSLLLRVIHGLVPATSGLVLWDDRPPDNAVARNQSLVFQKPVLLRRSVAANLDFVLKARGIAAPGRREALLERVDLADKADQPARSLSGGEQQRLALARALATDPTVLLMDEPTASLDPASTHLIEAIALDAVQRGTKVIFVTHGTRQARRLAGDVVFLERGKLAEHTPAETFFKSPTSTAARAYFAGRLLL